jgi:hypothetical protein
MAKTTTQDADTAAAIVTLGVDTHQDAHLGVALDQLGRRLGHLSVPTTVAGYEELLQWAEGFGELGGVGVEGTGCYGAGSLVSLPPAGSRSSRSAGPSADTAAVVASRTLSTLRRPPELFWRAPTSARPKAPTAGWR